MTKKTDAFVLGITDSFSLIFFTSGEVYSIARTSAPIKVIVHYPKTEEGKRELADRVARVHADMVNQTLKNLNCPSYQKEQLLDAVIEAAYKERDEGGRTR